MANHNPLTSPQPGDLVVQNGNVRRVLSNGYKGGWITYTVLGLLRKRWTVGRTEWAARCRGAEIVLAQPEARA